VLADKRPWQPPEVGEAIRNEGEDAFGRERIRPFDSRQCVCEHALVIELRLAGKAAGDQGTEDRAKPEFDPINRLDGGNKITDVELDSGKVRRR